MLVTRNLYVLFILIFISTLGCQSNLISRQPNNVQYEFDSSKVQLLTWAAQNRIMFQFPDSTFSDVSVSQVQETCKTLKEQAWSEAVFTTLENIKKNVALQNKVHVIEVRRGENPNVETSKDLDGVTYLVLSYSVSEKKTKITDVAQIPCDNKSTLLLGEELTETHFVLPATTAIAKVIKELPARTTPDRWKFNTDFLKFLASKMTLLRFSADLGFERSADGQFFLSQFLDEQAAADKKNHYTAYDYRLTEITQHSHTGSYLKIMALVQDKQLGYGMGTTQNTRGLAYPILSYKSQDGKYTYTSLNQLNQCLEELSSKYKRGLASIRSDYSTQADSFLYPGHICHSENP